MPVQRDIDKPFCMICGHKKFKNVRNNVKEQTWIRIRECLACGCRHKTEERIVKFWKNVE